MFFKIAFLARFSPTKKDASLVAKEVVFCWISLSKVELKANVLFVLSSIN